MADIYIEEHLRTVALLRRRGIDNPTHDEYADAAALVMEAAETGHPVEVVGATRGASFENGEGALVSARVLAKFAADGKFVGDLSIDEEAFLAEAIRQQELLDLAGVGTVAADGFAGVIDGARARTIAADDRDVYCAECGHVHAGWKECPQR